MRTWSFRNHSLSSSASSLGTPIITIERGFIFPYIKDAPECRLIQPPEQGRVVELKQVGGPHDEYLRMAA